MIGMSFEQMLPVVFMGLMGLAMLVYVVSDGYDLGVGMLMHRATAQEKDVLIASIGPFWDANETWLVLGIGILLIAFPKAHGLVLTELYLPVALMLVGCRCLAAGAAQPAWHARGARGAVLAAFGSAHHRVRARLPRPGLQHLPVRRDRPHDGVAGRQRNGRAEGDPGRGVPFCACHRRVHGVLVLRVLRQGRLAALCIVPKPFRARRAR